MENINNENKKNEIIRQDNEIYYHVKEFYNNTEKTSYDYCNITPIAQHYNKDISKFFKNKATHEYIDALGEFLPPNIEVKYTKRGKETEDNKGTFGTYLHIKLLPYFMQWLLPIKQYLEFMEFYNLDLNIQTKKEYSSVYCVLCDDDTIKIGISISVDRRFKEIENSSGKSIIKSTYTDKISNAYSIEQKLLGYFDDYRINGEWLNNISFSKVLDKLKEFIERDILNDILFTENNTKLILKE